MTALPKHIVEERRSPRFSARVTDSSDDAYYNSYEIDESTITSLVFETDVEDVIVQLGCTKSWGME